MTTATKTYCTTRYEMNGSNIVRYYLTAEGEWTPNRAKGQTFETIQEALSAHPTRYASALIERVS